MTALAHHAPSAQGRVEVCTLAFKWSRERWAAAAGAIVLTIALPIAIDQGYFRYNPYALPALGVAALLLYVGLFVTSDTFTAKVRKYQGGFGNRHPMTALIIFIGAGAVAGALIAAIGYTAIKSSKAHVAETKKRDEASVEEKRNPLTATPPPNGSDMQPPLLAPTTQVKPAPPESVKTPVVVTRERQTRVPPQQQASTTVIETAPTFGNLADRAIALSNEIMADMYWRGWPRRGLPTSPANVGQRQMPNTSEGRAQWRRSQSNHFQFSFLDRVLDMRNEFAQLHLRDEKLDDFFKYQGMIEQANRQMAAVNPGGQKIDIAILPQQIEEVADRLRVLANQVPTQRAAPRPLHFSMVKVQPQKPQFSFEVVITIDTDTDVLAGFIVVEFDGGRAYTATDYADGKLIFANDDDIIGNRPLKDYLLSRDATDVYALEIGKTPFMPKKPIHVIAYGSKPFSVAKVTLFDK